MNTSTPPQIKEGSTVLQIPTKNTALAVICFLFRIKVNRRRVYTEDFLAHKRLRAREALAKRELGEIFYWLDNEHPLIAQVIQAFDEEQKAIQEGRNLEIPDDVPPEIIAKIAARVLEARRVFIDDLFKLMPHLRIKHAGGKTRVENKDGGWTEEIPGYMDVPLDADEETLRDLGLIGRL
jgi:hypothetical protein